MIDVSIIIINYNTFELTTSCIESIYKYTSGISFEIILVDNASSECDADKFLERFSSIRIIRNENNVGFSRANNQAISVANGAFVLLLNSDTYLTDDSISLLYNEVKSKSHVAISSGKLYFPSGVVQGCCQRFPSIRIFLFEFTRLQKFFSKDSSGKILLGSFFKYEQEIYPDWVWGTFMMIRRDLIQKLPDGKLNEDFFMYCEDIQWCMDFRKMGYLTYYSPKASVIHIMGGSSANTKALNATNFEKFLMKNYSFFHARILIWIYKYYYRWISYGR